jgi:ABC-type branched-subunit amino acid transport system ATPase component/MFS family permease
MDGRDGQVVAAVEADPASMTRALLDQEEERLARRGESEVLFADDLLPGVGRAPMRLRDGLAAGGARTFIVLLILNSLDELESSVFNVLGPEIQGSLGVSDGVIVFLGTASVAFFVLGAVPFGWLSDRYRRPPIVGAATLVFGGFVFLTGIAVNAFAMFWARLGAGVAKANTLTVHPSLLADTYPVEVRGRIFAITATAGRALGLASPLLAGLIADAAGADGWRLAFFVLGLPVTIMAVLAFRLPEPPRGQWEQRQVLGTVLEDDPLRPSIEAAFARLWRIRTLRTLIVAFSAMGFFLFAGQSILYLYLGDEFGLSAAERGVVGSLQGLGVVLVAPFVGRAFDRIFRVDPSRALRLIGLLLLPTAALVPLQYAMTSVVPFVILAAVTNALIGGAFSVVGAVTQSVVPYQLRGLGQAISTMYIFLIGGVGAGLVGALLVDAFGQRLGMILIAVPAMAIGGLLVLRGASLIRDDLAMIVADLREELDEQERQRADPENIPAVQVNGIDFSYGPVQVLFDLTFEVARGETLALLGTNGAGKSTILKVLTGLCTPERGVVRLHGRTVTYTAPERRAALGIQMLPGGRGVFRHLTVRDNLVVGAFQYRKDPDDVERRIAGVLQRLPVLADRLDALAGDLSGGQQQMLALARVLLHEPDVLIIDELSLGLAPTVVQELLEMIRELQAMGQTMIIVEQSLNVALSIADRAVFLEKGRVRFDGDARELAERGDLARAVFLGADPA